MAEPFLGEIRMVSFSFAPPGWALCAGQSLSIQQYQALYAILGPTYGGDGKSYFNLPNLQGRVPIGAGQGQAMTVNLGQVLGEEAHTLTVAEMPAHAHQVYASTDPRTSASPAGSLWTTQDSNTYATQTDGNMADSAIATAGASQGHSNLQPYQVVNYIIALQGIFPTRN